MDTTSIWRATAAPTGYAMLQLDVECDVLIVGGGITGVTLALLLAREGRSVVLLEAHAIGSGSTGNSTGNLYETLSRGIREVAGKWGDDVARQVVQVRRSAVDFIEGLAAGTQAGFRRCDLYLYATSEAERGPIAAEFDALSRAGCKVRMTQKVPSPLPQPVREAVVLEGQAQFQPQAYVVHVASLAQQAGASLHEHSRVIEFDAKARRAVTATGSVVAKEVVFATHTPKGLQVVHAEMPVHREYGVSWPISDADPGPGIFWFRGSDHYSVRAVETDGGKFLVCVGPEHKTGNHNAKAGLMALQDSARHMFNASETVHCWSAQNYRPADALPYIGRDTSGVFIATGFATDGLTWGTVAARLIAEQLAGRSPAFGELCRPQRFSPVKGAKTLLEEAATMTKALVKDYLTHRQEEDLAALAAGDSAIIKAEGESLAAYRAPDGELFAVSSVCTHMGCKVHWNSVETSWDCPCHGSRFRPDGSVIEGPALRPLRRKYVKLGESG